MILVSVGWNVMQNLLQNLFKNKLKVYIASGIIYRLFGALFYFWRNCIYGMLIYCVLCFIIIF